MGQKFEDRLEELLLLCVIHESLFASIHTSKNWVLVLGESLSEFCIYGSGRIALVEFLAACMSVEGGHSQEVQCILFFCLGALEIIRNQSHMARYLSCRGCGNTRRVSYADTSACYMVQKAALEII